MLENGSHPGHSARGVAEPPARSTFGGRYQVVRLLKQGNGIDTVLGTDLVENEPVVIKTARGDSLSVGAQMRLEHEASVLRQVRGQGLAPLLSFGHEDGLV